MRFSRALALLENLTDREAEVFELLGLGLSNRGIATDLRITERTVKAHVARTLDKLGLNGRCEGAVVAYMWRCSTEPSQG